MNAFRRFGLVAVLLASVCPLTAAEKPWPLPPGTYFLERIPPPPADLGFRDRMDLRHSVAEQAQAEAADIAKAEGFVQFNVFAFSDVLGPKFTAKNFPATAMFFNRLETTANGPKNFIKDHYARIRPYLAHPESIKLLITPDSGFSYPSGHATRSWLYAQVLSELAPAKRQALLEHAAAVARSRVIGGMHYRSDIAASRELAELIFHSLGRDPEFLADLRRLRISEWTTK
jgi:acid phosphatase (class A)